jgi:glycosyltransferase involved in cell wall biosynthesis
MRSLFITNKFLGDGESPVTGTYKRMELFLEAISGLSNRLDLLVMVPHTMAITTRLIDYYVEQYASRLRCPFDLRLIPRLPPPGHRTIRGYLTRPWDLYSPGWHRYFMTSGTSQVTAIREAFSIGPDLVFAHRLNVMAPILRGHLQHPALFLDLDDVEHKAHLRHVLAPPRWPSKYLGLLHTPPLLWAEKQALGMALRTYVCSPQDRDYLRRLYGSRQVEDITNAVAIPRRTPVPVEPTLLFLGSTIFAPNLAAASWLIEQVWPTVHAAVSAARLIIAGEFPEQIAAFQAPPPGVEFRGFVADLDELYRETRVVTCPVLSGSGTRVKLVEAAAYGRPAVSTRIGAEGLALEEEHHILLRDNAAEFARACIRLLNDQPLCNRMGDAARRVAEQQYDRAAIIERIRGSVTAAMVR